MRDRGEPELCSAALSLSVMLVESFCSSCTRRRKAVFGVGLGVFFGLLVFVWLEFFLILLNVTPIFTDLEMCSEFFAIT